MVVRPPRPPPLLRRRIPIKLRADLPTMPAFKESAIMTTPGQIDAHDSADRPRHRFLGVGRSRLRPWAAVALAVRGHFTRACRASRGRRGCRLGRVPRCAQHADALGQAGGGRGGRARSTSGWACGSPKPTCPTTTRPMGCCASSTRTAATCWCWRRIRGDGLGAPAARARSPRSLARRAQDPDLVSAAAGAGFIDRASGTPGAAGPSCSRSMARVSRPAGRLAGAAARRPAGLRSGACMRCMSAAAGPGAGPDRDARRTSRGSSASRPKVRW